MESEAPRQIKLSNGKSSQEVKFPGNAIKTSKYTPATFAPMNLFEQLHKFGNVYFLIISVLMYLGEKTTLFIGTIKAFSTLATLMMMMAVTALVAYLDDEQRKKADRETNMQNATRLGDAPAGDVAIWQDLVVGDVVIIKQDEELPADVVVVYCAGEKGNCYVSTANLDGETNLKLKASPPSTQSALGKSGSLDSDVCKELRTLELTVDAEAPKTSIHDFQGRLQFSSNDESLDLKHILLRGTVLRNTAWCLGIVVYTGQQTRMVMNSRAAPMKQSNLERVTNSVMRIILCAQASLALLSDFIFLFKKGDFESYWYLYPPDLILPDFLAYWLTFFVLYSNMMPISLYPTMEACNSAQSYFIKNDKEMYYKDLEFPAGVRSTNLCQEIGQVKYVFSDKTGTLTQNVMELKKMSIVGNIYGTMVEGEKGFNGCVEMDSKRRQGGDNGEIDSVLEVLAVSHTAMVARKDDSNIRKWVYEVESPDEGALVEAAADCGWVFESRDGDTVNVDVKGQGMRSYTILATNEFNSTRKRMSVVVSSGGKAFILAKGADNVMFERSINRDKVLDKHLTEFSVDGLRTLVFARRDLSPDELAAWQKKYDAAMRLVGDDREGQLAKAAEDIEKDLTIVGASAIEDKLQDGVPDTIVKIREAGVKLWVLTGDKLETAENIGYSSKVLTAAMLVVKIETGDASGIAALEQAGDQIKNGGREAGMMITGAALEAILLSDRHRKTLLDVANACSVLIACRVSPLQKAEMVKLVRSEIKDAVTLGIGDGANDVPMIQEAHVGVGIAGREGRQAVNNSDFAIGQFRFLQRLMLVHGRWNYRRVCKFTLFTFWRNAVQVLMIFYYTFISGFSGTSLFEDWIRLSFNFLCSFPIMATGCFDQDVHERVALAFPQLYACGREGKDLNPRKIVNALMSAITHSLILLFYTILAFPAMDIAGAGDYYTFGTAVYTCLLIDMNYRAAFITSTHNRWTIGSIVASFVLYVFYLYVYPCTKFITDLLAPNMYMVPYHMASHTVFWMCILAVPALAITVDMFLQYVFQTTDKDAQQVYEMSRRVKDDGTYDKGTDYAYEKVMDAVANAHMARQEDSPEMFNNKIDVSAFAQQTTFMRRWTFDGRFVQGVMAVLCIFNLTLGGLALQSSMSSKQIRIHYEGPPGYDPWGTLESEVVCIQEQCAAARKKGDPKCRTEVTLPADMEPPILLYYAIGPYYQNYNNYLKSEVPKELHGLKVAEADREAMCIEPTRIDSNGDQIVPCGMKATSMFNDSFKVTINGRSKELDIDNSNLAWKEDKARYGNPVDYAERKKTDWLYERYPDVVKKHEGVDNEQFLVWMRPSALQRVWNPYGYIRDTTLKKGDKITVEIETNYPMFKMGGWKQLVLTTVGPMGGRHHGFGLGLILSGVGCAVLFVVVMFMERCKPKP